MLPLCECGSHGVGKAGNLLGIVTDAFSPSLPRIDRIPSFPALLSSLSSSKRAR